MKTIGQKIKERRKKLKMTLEELGAKCDSGKSYIWEIENKTNARPSADKLNKISSALGISLSFLLDKNIVDDRLSNLEELFLSELRKLPQVKKEQLFQIMKIL